jgi:hypothetical protein
MGINDSTKEANQLSKYAEYDYLEIYNESVLGKESLEDSINQLRRSGKKYRYMVKTIQSGDMLESEIYPLYEKRKEIPRRDRERQSKPSQDNLNDKNARKIFIRKVNANFGKDDLLITLTYEDRYLPTLKQAKKDVQNYLRRIKTYRKNHGLPELKYIYVLEYVDEEEQHKSKKIRVHHHILINKMDRDAAEDLWKRGRVEARRLQPDDFGLEGIARYLLKDPRGKRWYGSRNLKEPKVNKSATKLTRRKAERMVMEPDKLPEIFEKMYKGKYKYNDCQTYISDITGGFYLYCRMHRRD